MDQLRGDGETLRGQLDQQKLETAAARDELSAARQQLADKDRDADSLRSQLEAARLAAESKDKEIEGLQLQVADRRKDIAELTAKNAEAIARAESAAREIEQQRSQTAAAHSLAEYRQKDLDSMAKQLDSIRQELDKATLKAWAPSWALACAFVAPPSFLSPAVHADRGSRLPNAKQGCRHRLPGWETSGCKPARG